MAKGLINALKGYGDIQRNEAKLNNALLVNQIEKKQKISSTKNSRTPTRKSDDAGYDKQSTGAKSRAG